MSNKIEIKNTIKPFNKKVEIEGDKSLSIRWALLASQSIGKSTSTNLLMSEDVLNTLNCLKKLGVKIKLNSFTLVKQLIINPFVTIKIILAILYESIFILLKGGKYYARKKKINDSISYEGKL